MDKLTTYRQALSNIIQEHGQHQPSHDQIQTLTICDPITDNYLLIDSGWGNSGRIHAIAIHARIVNQKIWIEHDGTETGIAEQLLNQGIPPQDIVLGFMRPQRRALTEFAIA